MSIIIESKIDSGSFGSIFKVCNNRNGVKEYQAVKVFPIHRGEFKSMLEIILSMLKCRYLISGYDYEIDKKLIKIYMPLALCNLTKISRYKVDVKKIMFDVCLGIKYLHNYNIVHGDIKLSNILLFRNGKEYMAKISDFGLSKVLKTNSEFIYNSNVYTGEYKPPELDIHNGYNLKSDIWALGKVFKKIYIPENEEDKKNFKILLNNMLEFNYQNRFDIIEVINSEFFSDFLFKNSLIILSYDYQNLYEDMCIFIPEIPKDVMKVISNKFFGIYDNSDDLDVKFYEITYYSKIYEFWKLYIFKN